MPVPVKAQKLTSAWLKPEFHRAGNDAVDIGDQTVGGDRANVDTVGGDGVTDQPPNRVIGTPGPTRADAEELLLRTRPSAAQHGGPDYGRTQAQRLATRGCRHRSLPSRVPK